jgi:hypothetical protein
MEPTHNGQLERIGKTDNLPAGLGSFGTGRLSRKLYKKLLKIEEQAIEQSFEHDRISFLTRKTVDEVSASGVYAYFRKVSDLEMMNRIREAAHSLTEEQIAALAADELSHLQRISECVEAGKEHHLETLADQAGEKPKFGYF